MMSPVRIILPLPTWELLEETLLQLLPGISQIRIEIVVTPSPQMSASPSDAHLHKHLKTLQTNLHSQYPRLTFNFDNIISENYHDDLDSSLSSVEKTHLFCVPAS